MLSAALLLLLLFEAVALSFWGLSIYRSGHSALWAILIPIATAMSIRALIVLLTFVLSGNLRQRGLLATLRSAFGEGVVMLYLYTIALPLEKLFAPRPSASGPVVVLVHGFLCNGGMWGGVRRALQRAGFHRVHTLNLDPLYRSMPQQILRFERALDRIRQDDPNAQIFVIGHSMGGVLARMVFAQHPERFSAVVCVGAPHQGTDMARWVSTIQKGPARPDSSWLSDFWRRHQQLPASHATNMLNIYSDADNIVAPQRNAVLSEAEGSAQLMRPGFGHLHLVFDGKSIASIIEFLKQRSALPP